MSGFTFGIVLLAAVLHACWNFAARQAAGRFPVLWLGQCAGLAFLLPLVIGHWMLADNTGRLLTPAGLGCTLSTGLIHGAYFHLLARAYQLGEISIVYPVARGSGIGLTALFAVLLLKEPITANGMIGIALISSGILLMGRAALKQRNGASSGVGMALCVGATIVGYSLIDKVGVAHVAPIPYLFFMSLISTGVLAPFVLSRYRGDLKNIWREYKTHILVIGVGANGTYLLILFAFQTGNVSYIVALREFAVVIGSALGVLLLKETMTRPKLIAIIAITLGLIFIKLA